VLDVDDLALRAPSSTCYASEFCSQPEPPGAESITDVGQIWYSRVVDIRPVGTAILLL